MRQRLKGEKYKMGFFVSFFLKVRRGVKIGVTIISKKRKIKHDHQFISLHDSLKIYQ